MNEDKDVNGKPSDDGVISIGTLDVPLWQFNIYYNEAEKFLLELHREAAASHYTGVSKALVRSIHTLAGISNTLGAEPIARLGYALEDWLTNIYEERGSDKLTEPELVLLDMATAALTTMVESIRLKEPILDERYDVLALLQEIDTQNHEKKMSASMDTGIQPDGSTSDLDWLASELKTLDESLNFEASPNADWVLDLDTLSSDIDAVSSIGHSLDSVADDNQTPERVRQVRDYRTYVAELLPSDDVEDQPEEGIRDIFTEEATEIFDSLPDDVEAWAETRGSNAEISGRIMRALHTLKGSSRMAGYFRFGTVVHNIETIMEAAHPVLKKDEIPDLLQAVCDALVQELRHILNPAESSGLTRAALVSKHLNESNIPETPQFTQEQVSPKPIQDSEGAVVREEISTPRPAPTPVKVVKTPKPSTSPEESNVNTSLRVPTEKIDALANQLGRAGTIHLRVETSVVRMSTQIKEMSSNLDRLRRLLKDVEIQAESQMKSRLEDAKRENAAFDPLEFDRFTRLQELTRMTAEALHDIDNSHTEVMRGLTDIQDSIAENNILAEDMQHAVMSVRTVPLKTLTRRLEPLIRQASLDTQKQVTLSLDSDVEVDSGILNKIVAPLEHLIRNAIAHGIEMPEKRVSLGKPAKGTVTLQVRNRGNDTVFKLSDDGAGINRAAVEKRARERGLVPADAVLTQEQANQMIFEPGFSTAETVNELAGRGVGMDVVMGIISDMGGRILTSSIDGQGSTFELVVPSYMSVISMVPVRAQNIDYAIPSSLVRDVIVVRDVKILEAYESGYLNLDGLDYPFYGLSEASGIEAPDIQRNNRIMLVDDQQGIAAIHIDSLGVDRNLVMKPLCRTIATLPGLLGASIAGDGSPLLVINPVQLRQSVDRKKRAAKRAEVLTSHVKTRADMTVMVIDDSLTIRRITQKFLTRAGFKVVLAVDGLDAIEKLSTHGAPDLYLTDIEMPNMDGFQLTEHIRTSVSKETPIVMISSRSIEKYAEHARSLGVNRSLGKPYQEPELLSVIEELLGLKEANK